MPDYQSPGVYVEEVDKGMKPIEAVGTAVAAFIGYTERAEDTEAVLDEAGQPMVDSNTGQPLLKKTDLRGKPTLVTNWSQYVKKFGEFTKGAYLPDAVYGYFSNGGGRCYVVSIKALNPVDGDSADGGSSKPELTVSGSDNKPLLKFLSKGSRSDSVKIEIQPDKTATATTAASKAGSKDDADKDDDKSGDSDSGETFRLVITPGSGAPETYDNLTVNKVETLLKTRSRLVDVQVMPTAQANIVPKSGSYNLEGAKANTKEKAVTVKDYQGDVAKRRGIGGLEPIEEVTMIAVPDLMSSYQSGEIDLVGVKAIQQSVIDYCERVSYCFAILDSPPNLMPQEMLEWRLSTQYANYDSSRAAVYYPWIKIADQTGANGRVRSVPPSGHIAGIFARNDATRGVHKAPANEVVRGALDLDVQITKGEQDMLNPNGINAIRAFPGRGIRVWGARTLSSDPAWRYINVRRLFNMIEQSIERGTQWIVFEPNDPNLWARVRRDISAFLKLVWRSGALFGTTTDQAFYVKCDAETNPIEVREAGQLVVEIGMAPVKPAEFVIFRISQWAGPDASGE